MVVNKNNIRNASVTSTQRGCTIRGHNNICKAICIHISSCPNIGTNIITRLCSHYLESFCTGREGQQIHIYKGKSRMTFSEYYICNTCISSAQGRCILCSYYDVSNTISRRCRLCERYYHLQRRLKSCILLLQM